MTDFEVKVDNTMRQILLTCSPTKRYANLDVLDLFDGIYGTGNLNLSTKNNSDIIEKRSNEKDSSMSLNNTYKSHKSSSYSSVLPGDSDLDELFSVDHEDLQLLPTADYGIFNEIEETKRILALLQREKDDAIRQYRNASESSELLRKRNQDLEYELFQARNELQEMKKSRDLERDVSHLRALEDIKKKLRGYEEKVQLLEAELSRFKIANRELEISSKFELSQVNDHECELSSLCERLREKLAKYKRLYDESLKQCNCQTKDSQDRSVTSSLNCGIKHGQQDHQFLKEKQPAASALVAPGASELPSSDFNSHIDLPRGLHNISNLKIDSMNNSAGTDQKPDISFQSTKSSYNQSICGACLRVHPSSCSYESVPRGKYQWPPT